MSHRISLEYKAEQKHDVKYIWIVLLLSGIVKTLKYILGLSNFSMFALCLFRILLFNCASVNGEDGRVLCTSTACQLSPAADWI